MDILLATSEVVPFAKTGGLADVCGSLPIELSRLGHQATVVLPAYRHAKQAGIPIESTGVKLEIPIGSKVVTGSILRSQLPGSNVTTYLIEQDEYYDRAELYRENGEDYKDNCERFVFFCRSVMESIRLLGIPTDVLHANDWQTSLLTAYLNTEYRDKSDYSEIASVFTIHNLAYQGQFWHWDMLLTGLDWKYFNWHQMEFYGHLNLMKTGIVFADSVTTVSPRYAQEIQAHPLGCGLEGVLQHRQEYLSGILNGVSYDDWNPATDNNLAVQYSVDNWREGKAACKASLQLEVGLPEAIEHPLIGLVGRLADQKGLDLVAAVIGKSLESSDAQWVILGTGEPEYHALFQKLAGQYPEKIAARLEFSNQLAHRIEAGADIFMMPSRYEPCGLNQLYSLKYGTVPIVRETGGLADTITDATAENLQAGIANGFSFQEYSPEALDDALHRALQTYQRSDLWSQLVTTGMNQDWSWQRSAQEYIQLYEKTIARRKQMVYV